MIKADHLPSPTLLCLVDKFKKEKQIEIEGKKNRKRERTFLFTLFTEFLSGKIQIHVLFVVWCGFFSRV